MPSNTTPSILRLSPNNQVTPKSEPLKTGWESLPDDICTHILTLAALNRQRSSEEVTLARRHVKDLLCLRILCKDAIRVADSQPLLEQKLFAVRKGMKRRDNLNVALRSSRNASRWRSLKDVKGSKIALLMVAKHVKIGPVSAPSQKLVLNCLHGLDGALATGDYDRDFHANLVKLGGYKLEYLVRSCIHHPNRRVECECKLDHLVAEVQLD